MNKELICLENKAIVIDEKGEKKLLPYEENTEEILEQENLIETKNYEISTLKYELKQLSEDISNGKFFRNSCIIMPLATNLVLFLINQLGGLASSASIFPIISLISISFFPIAAHNHLIIKHSKKQVISKNAQLDYLDRTLKKDKTKLDELKKTNNPSTMPKDYFFTKKISNEKETRLATILKLHDYLITNPNELQDFLEKGVIPKEYKKAIITQTDTETIKSTAKKHNLVRKKQK